MNGPDLTAQVRRLEREHDNFRAALGRARTAGEDQLRAELGCSLSRFWLLEGYLEDVRQTLRGNPSACPYHPASARGMTGR